MFCLNVDFVQSILGEFNREQDAFLKGKQGSNSDAAVPPWVGCANEESLKEECLSLSTVCITFFIISPVIAPAAFSTCLQNTSVSSLLMHTGHYLLQDRRNFVRSPPAGVDFQFDYDISYPIAIATMTEDPNLEKMRFELVPKVYVTLLVGYLNNCYVYVCVLYSISEENFWRNYFYRVSLICQANELSYMGREGENQSTDMGNADSQQLGKHCSHNHPSTCTRSYMYIYVACVRLFILII